jgi:hypothetical protein
MGKCSAIALVLIVLAMSAYGAGYVGHPAADISGGLFPSDYYFINRLTVNSSSDVEFRINSGPNWTSALKFMDNATATPWVMGRDRRGYFYFNRSESPSYAVISASPFNGYVGIGTSYPGARLDVAGSVRSQGNIHIFNRSRDGGYLFWYGGYNESDYYRAHMEPDDALRFYWNESTSPSLTLTKDGRLGISTADPTEAGAVSSKLTVRQIDDSTGFAIMSPTAQKRFAINPTALGASFWGIDAGGNWLRVMDFRNGFVGIGNPTPAYTLDVTGSVHSTGDICTDAGVSPPNCLSEIDSLGGGGDGWTDNGNEVVLSTTTDKVGIGTASPGIAEVKIANQGTDVGLFVGDSATAPYGQAMIEINPPAGATHIWAQEGATRVFSVTAGGRVYAKGGVEFNDGTVQTSASAGGARTGFSINPAACGEGRSPDQMCKATNPNSVCGSANAQKWCSTSWCPFMCTQAINDACANGAPTVAVWCIL